MNKGKRWVKSLLWLMIMCAMGMMFFLSGQTAAESSALSWRVASKIARTIIPNIYYIQDSVREKIVAVYNGWVRDAAHVTEYTLLGALLMFLWQQYPFSVRKRVLFASGMALVFSVIDEYHQVYVSGRGAQVTDVLLDMLGASLGIVFVLLLWLMLLGIVYYRKDKAAGS